MSTLVKFHMVTQKPLWFASGRVSCAKNLPNRIYKAAYCAYNSISLSLSFWIRSVLTQLYNVSRRGYPCKFPPWSSYVMLRDIAIKTQVLHHRLYRPQLSCSGLKFMTVHLEKDWTCMGCLDVLPARLECTTPFASYQAWWWRSDDFAATWPNRAWLSLY